MQNLTSKAINYVDEGKRMWPNYLNLQIGL